VRASTIAIPLVVAVAVAVMVMIAGIWKQRGKATLRV
jgi:archaellin